jgi:hypothetical protein
MFRFSGQPSPQFVMFSKQGDVITEAHVVAARSDTSELEAV